MPEQYPANRINDTKQELYGFRDERISRRHREYGLDCAATDIDFILLEYSVQPDGTYRRGAFNAIPKALFEYKHWNADRKKSIHSASNKAVYRLAQLADLPFFMAFYDPEIWCFDVFPFGKKAEAYLETPLRMSEQNYVRLLYRIRMRPPKESIIKQLKDEIHELPQAGTE
jgi:hypothetical protein